MTDAARITEGLTEAQRRKLLDAPFSLSGYPILNLSCDSEIFCARSFRDFLPRLICAPYPRRSRTPVYAAVAQSQSDQGYIIDLDSIPGLVQRFDPVTGTIRPKSTMNVTDLQYPGRLYLGSRTMIRDAKTAGTWPVQGTGDIAGDGPAAESKMPGRVVPGRTRDD